MFPFKVLRSFGRFLDPFDYSSLNERAIMKGENPFQGSTDGEDTDEDRQSSCVINSVTVIMADDSDEIASDK